MKKHLILLVVAVLLILPYYALAVTPGGAQITDNGETGYTERSPDSVNVTAGFIRSADLYAEMSTYRWAGLFGNVSGTIVLASGSGLSADKMFQWSANASVVFASEASSVAWSSLTNVNETQVLANYSFLGSGSDNYNATFNNVGTLNTNTVLGGSINANFANTLDNESNAFWKTFILGDGSNIVFAGVVEPAGHASFNSSIVQYQMILPEDGSNGDTTATAYNIWVELI
ncbi:MAG: hypothetical protein PWP03_805 [Candidatus Woesearchaeota archaeon]|nr:hypothetical protein [Candidatus Woesearchaeota archaeon]MDN5328167.1 hypothetical protein [Candidatus Woesearchaeota archaeon]